MSIKQAFARKRRKSWLGLLVICATLITTFTILALPTAAASISSSANDAITESSTSGPSIQLFEADLSGASEVPAVNTNASGRAVLAVSADGTMLHYRVMLHDITGVTKAHIHEGVAGSNGSSVITLFVSDDGTFDENNPVSGSAALTAEQLATLQAGNYYINVHTEANGSGEVRGQLSSYTPPSSFNALLTGSQEVPAVSTDAVGVARFGLAGNTLTYTVDVSNITGITKAHIHMGAAGANGSSVFTLFNAPDGGTFDPDNPVSGSATLTATHLVDLLTSHYYINVHTEANGSGEIRGQIGGARVFNSSLSGANEVPAVETSASGEAIVTMNAAADMIYYRVMVSNIMSITKAHIHNAPAGENGSSIITLFNAVDADSGSFDADNPASGSSAITTAQLLDMLSGNHYINIHTDANGSGEIRGQLAHYTPPTEFDTTLSGANEVPAVTTSASGSGHFELDANMPRLHYQVSVSDIMGVTKAHIHKAAAGSNGSSVFTLYNSTRANALNAFDPDNPVGGAFALNAENLMDLLTNYYYVNVHTEANGSGEVRGQIGSSADPTAVTVSTLNAGSTSGSLIFALMTLAFTMLGGAYLFKQRAS